jgi:hypothetical protein
LGSSDGPSYGRRYDIFYNQIKIGDLEIEAHWNYSPAAPEVTTAIELDWARLLRFGQISNLIYWIGILTASGGGPSGEERRAAMDALRGAALDQLWQIEYDRDIDDRAMGGRINIQFSGTADLERLTKFGR